MPSAGTRCAGSALLLTPVEDVAAPKRCAAAELDRLGKLFEFDQFSYVLDVERNKRLEVLEHYEPCSIEEFKAGGSVGCSVFHAAPRGWCRSAMARLMTRVLTAPR
jgi:hypothetical protein